MESSPQAPLPDRQADDIPRWAREYAQTRPAGVMGLCLVIMLANIAAIAGTAHLARASRAAGNEALFWVWTGLCVVSCLFTVWLSVPRWGGRAIRRWAEHLFGTEGYAEMTPDLSTATRRMVNIVAVIFFVGIQVLVWGPRVPLAYQQPASALVVVPFLFMVIRAAKGSVGRVYYLWPVLYLLHALLIVAGAPILFTGGLAYLNILIPTFGYGLLTALIGYLQSRRALRKLKEGARWTT